MDLQTFSSYITILSSVDIEILTEKKEILEEYIGYMQVENEYYRHRVRFAKYAASILNSGLEKQLQHNQASAEQYKNHIVRHQQNGQYGKTSNYAMGRMKKTKNDIDDVKKEMKKNELQVIMKYKQILNRNKMMSDITNENAEQTILLDISEWLDGQGYIVSEISTDDIFRLYQAYVRG